MRNVPKTTEKPGITYPVQTKDEQQISAFMQAFRAIAICKDIKVANSIATRIVKTHEKTKKLLILALLSVLAISACKKEDWVTPIPIGTMFNYDIGSNSLKWLVKPDGHIPTNPFRVDSVAVGAYKGYNGYWCSSANGLSYVIDPTIIRAHIIK